jgi:hypothetical protein
VIVMGLDDSMSSWGCLLRWRDCTCNYRYQPGLIHIQKDVIRVTIPWHNLGFIPFEMPRFPAYSFLLAATFNYLVRADYPRWHLWKATSSTAVSPASCQSARSLSQFASYRTWQTICCVTLLRSPQRQIFSPF